MRTLTPIALSALLAFAAAPAFAAQSQTPAQTPAATTQTNGANSNMNSNESNMSGAQQTRVQQLRADLTGAGFTDVKVMPESFLVRAKDKQGHPVMMVINPDSITAITAANTPGANGNASSTNPNEGAQNRANNAASQPSNQTK